MSDTEIEWIAVDWGTSRLRCWLMGGGGKPIKSLSSKKGMAGLKREEFEPALLELVGQFLASDGKTRVIACGMVGARQGWSEAPYADLPVAPDMPVTLHRVAATDQRLDVYILPGICQSAPPDVMRGEETQIAGFLANNSSMSGVFCMPGTHSKWVNVEEGQITGFTTCMTGELFAAVSSNTVLQHSVTPGWDERGFERGVTLSLNAPDEVPRHLFGIRAADLLHGQSGESAYSFLSGLLIGSEIAAMQTVWQGSEVILIGGDNLCKPYQNGLQIAGGNGRIVSGDTVVLEGLTAVYNSKFKQG